MTDFSVFDLLSPALSGIDSVLGNGAGLAPVWRIAFFAALGSIVSMLLFKKLSNQAALADLKQEIKAVHEQLVRPGNAHSSLGGVVQQNLRLTGRQLWLSFWPALFASVPIVFLLVFCSNQFGVEQPSTGSRVYVTPIDLQATPAEFEWQGVNAQWDARKAAWTFYYPEPGQKVSLMLGDRQQFGFPTAIPASVLHSRKWWNFLVANPAGYLDEHAGAGRFEFNTPTQVIINWGPGWMRGWLFAFMVFLVLFSVAIKIVWKIH